MLTVPWFSGRTASFALIAAFGAFAGLVAPQFASAQARPALVRDNDNADLAPVTFNVQSTGTSNTGGTVLVTTVPAGKRLIVDSVSYYCFASGPNLCALVILQKGPNPTDPPRLIVPTNPAIVSPGGSYFQSGAFAGRAIFEANESVYLQFDTTGAANVGPSINMVITGHYVTP